VGRARMNLDKQEHSLLKQELEELKSEHRTLDESIELLDARMSENQFEIQRLKKNKLKLKDAISRLESKLIPDLHA
jgi:hypothetical protein